MVFIQGWKVLDSRDDSQVHRLVFKRRGRHKLDQRDWGGQRLVLGSLSRLRLSLRGQRKILEIVLWGYRYQGVAL